MSKNFLDLLPEDERIKTLERAQKRLDKQKTKIGLDVSPEIYLVAEFGYYFGWDALLAIRRGYTVEPVSGEKEVLTLDEVQILLEGARKVWRSKLMEQIHGGVISNSFRSSSTSYESATAPIAEKAEVKE